MQIAIIMCVMAGKEGILAGAARNAIRNSIASVSGGA